MPFRNEREALLYRAQGLERDLADERSARERSEAQRDDLAQELARVRRQLARLGPVAAPAPHPNAALILVGAAVAAGLVMAGLVATMWTVRRAPAPAIAPPLPALPATPPIPLTPLVPANQPVAPPRAVPMVPPEIPTEALSPSTRRVPTRTEIAAAFQSRAPEVRSCAGRLHGTAMARVTFASSGRVTAVSMVDGTFAGTSEGSCIARTLRTMRVAPFENPSLTVTYPYPIRY
ncbi:MAG: hypothetical protein HYY06_23785 [Deltaproteobacteria bacterium]|nr:hypothetical protein [Deltaproteobacteria bacterium]